MNPSWDQGLAQARMDALGIPLKRKIKSLSGGQQAQVSLTVALAKRAPLLVLDEPVSSLDPVARLEFMREVMAAAVGSGLTVLIASRVVSELERLCDWLIVLAGGQVQQRGRPTTWSPRTSCSPCPARPRTPSFPGSSSTAPTVTGTPLCWSGPISPGWRQHRSQAIACLSLLTALAVYAIVVGSSMRTAFGQDGLVTCLARSQGTGCPAAIQTFTNRFGSEVNVRSGPCS